MSFSPNFLIQNGYEVQVLVGNENRRAEVYVAVARTDQQLKNLITDLIDEGDKKKLSDYAPALTNGLPEGQMVSILFLNDTLWQPVGNDIDFSDDGSRLSIMFLRGEEVRNSLYLHIGDLRETRLTIVSEFHDPFGNVPVLPRAPGWVGPKIGGLAN